MESYNVYNLLIGLIITLLSIFGVGKKPGKKSGDYTTCWRYCRPNCIIDQVEDILKI